MKKCENFTLNLFACNYIIGDECKDSLLCVDNKCFILSTNFKGEIVMEKKTVKKIEEVKATAPVVKEEVKAPVVKEAAPAKKAEKKPAAKKEAVKKDAVKESKTQYFIQYADKELTPEVIESKVKAAWMEETGKKESSIKSVKIYIKPEENAAYYVINDNNLGRVVL